MEKLLSEGWEVLSERSGSEAAPITVRLMEISKFGNLEYPEELPDLLGCSSIQAQPPHFSSKNLQRTGLLFRSSDIKR